MTREGDIQPMGPHVPLNVLFVVPYAPTRIRTRSYHFIRALASLGHRVTVATAWSTSEERAAVEATSSNGTLAVLAERLPRTRTLWNCMHAILTADPMQVHYSWSPGLARRLARAVDESAFDVIHVEHLRGARYALALAKRPTRPGARRAPVIWDSVDCISSLFRQAARSSQAFRVRVAARLELRRTERFEGRVVRQFARVLVTSDADRADLLELAGDAGGDSLAGRLRVVPCGVDLEYFSPTDESRDPATLVMTGKMSYHANATAAVRFVGGVMPGVWERVPGARLMLVGKDPPREVVRLQDVGAGRVIVTGTVADIRPFLRTATIAVAPIQYGVGIQNKVLEALACGTPVVATPQATSALAITEGRDVVVGRDAGELAAAIGALLGDADRRRRIGEAGRTFVERHHSWQAAAARLTDIYHDAIA